MHKCMIPECIILIEFMFPENICTSVYEEQFNLRHRLDKFASMKCGVEVQLSDEPGVVDCPLLRGVL